MADQSQEAVNASESPVNNTPANPASNMQASSSSSSYTSNPFIASAKALGDVLKVNPVSGLLAAFAAIAVYLGVYFGSLILGAFLPTIVLVIIMLAVFVFAIILFLRVYAASIVIHQKSRAKETISTKELLGSAASERLTALVGTAILMAIFTFLGLLLFVIPGIILAARFALAPFIVYDEKLSGMAAIKRSMELTKGHTFEMLGVIMAQAMISGNGLLGFASLNSGTATRYYELKEANGGDTGKTHWLNIALPLSVIAVIVLYIAMIASLIASIDSSSSSSSIYSDDDFESLFESELNNSDFDFDYNYDYSN